LGVIGRQSLREMTAALPRDRLQCPPSLCLGDARKADVHHGDPRREPHHHQKPDGHAEIAVEDDHCLPDHISKLCRPHVSPSVHPRHRHGPQNYFSHVMRERASRSHHSSDCRFEPVFAETQPVSGRLPIQISDIEKSPSRDPNGASAQKSPVDVLRIRTGLRGNATGRCWLGCVRARKRKYMGRVLASRRY
jgi:hypothetical protein